ncbi:hypothetical protein F751_4413 [Auxenochlorella protothecoides]|uniref:Uncharacterized protein n=1 Tax=Auxenochlorella protothecoides TaxID=3075 RepID=A0A087SCS7_AUXPR|nr:hypothetical protein F751_4413 [Auxenochlorella protothecoides]KFM23531.1 hypothetical protein F751_4413 [Auxenochlorella protothecoides]
MPSTTQRIMSRIHLHHDRIWKEQWLAAFFHKPCNHELFVLQSLNMEEAIKLARKDDMDWILHVDTDELMYPAGSPGFSLQEVLGAVPSHVDSLVFPNHEALPEREDVLNPFLEVTLFKKNFQHIVSDLYFKNYVSVAHGNPNYFVTYANGKAAARIHPGLRPNGAHRWSSYEKSMEEWTSEVAAVLHYTYNRFSDLKGRRDRCDCAPTEEDAKRCFILPFDRLAFLESSLRDDNELKQFFRDHLLWKQDNVTTDLLHQGLLARLYEPQAATTGMERALGTILGGFSGFLVFQIGELFWNEQTDGMVLTVGACVVSFVAILVGHKLKLDTSARLYIITFLLVIFGADRGSDAGLLAWNRVCGILAGVVLILILSILVFPKSASIECIRKSNKGYMSIGAEDVEAQVPGSAAAAAARAAAEDAFESKVEKVVTSVYQSCFKLMDNMVLADAEWYVGSYAGRPFFAPDLPLCLATKTQMPLEELAAVGVGIRRVARLLSQLINTLGYGFRAELQEMLGEQFPEEMMRKLGLSCQAVTKEMTNAFPFSPAIMPGPLVAFVSTVASLVSTSDMQRRQIIRALKKYRTQRPDRLGWDRLVDAMLSHRSYRPPGSQGEEQVDVAGAQSAPAQSAGAAGPTTGQSAGAAGPTTGQSAGAARRGSLPRVPEEERAAEGEAPGQDRASSSEAGVKGAEAPGAEEEEGARTAGSLQLAEGTAPPASAFAPSSDEGWRGEEGQEAEPSSSLLFRLSLPRAPSPEPAGASDGSPKLVDWARARVGSLSERLPSSRLSVHSGGAGSTAAEANAIGRSSLRAAAAAESSPGLAALLGPVSGLGERGKGPTARQLAALNGGAADPRLHVFLFPETPEGRVAQVRWYSFQYLLEEVTEELSALQHALNDTLAKLP